MGFEARNNNNNNNNNNMFRCFGDTLEHLITTCFGNAQEENHVIDKHSLQHKFKQNATAVAS